MPEEGAAITHKLSEILKLNIGDSVEWRTLGEKDWKKIEITAIYRTPMGQGLSITKKEYEKQGYIFQPTALLTADKVTGTEKFTLVQYIQDKKELMNSFEGILEGMKMIVGILILAAAVLGSVVLYNLGALSFTERIRELATLKVLGFFPKEIRSLLQRQNLWLTVIGIVIGLPAGYGLVTFMLTTMPDSTDMVADISIASLIISILGTLLLSVFINLFLSRKIRSIDMVSALKSVE